MSSGDSELPRSRRSSSDSSFSSQCVPSGNFRFLNNFGARKAPQPSLATSNKNSDLVSVV